MNYNKDMLLDNEVIVGTVGGIPVTGIILPEEFAEKESLLFEMESLDARIADLQADKIGLQNEADKILKEIYLKQDFLFTVEVTGPDKNPTKIYGSHGIFSTHEKAKKITNKTGSFIAMDGMTVHRYSTRVGIKSTTNVTIEELRTIDKDPGNIKKEYYED